MGSEAVLQAIEANIASSTVFYSSVWFGNFTTLIKVFRAAKLCLALPKYSKCLTYQSSIWKQNDMFVILKWKNKYQITIKKTSRKRKKKT